MLKPPPAGRCGLVNSPVKGPCTPFCRLIPRFHQGLAGEAFPIFQQAPSGPGVATLEPIRRPRTKIFAAMRGYRTLASISDVASATRLNCSGPISEMLATTVRLTVTRNVFATAGFRL